MPPQDGSFICVAAPQSLKGRQDVRSPACLSLRLKLEVSMKDLLKGGTIREQHAVVELYSGLACVKKNALPIYHDK